MADTSSLCDALISDNILVNCTEQAKGFESEGVIINRDDIDFSALVRNTTYPNVVTEMPLKTGKTGYKVQQRGQQAFGGTQTTMNAGTYMNSFTNELHLRIFDNGVKTAKIMDELANGKFVVILRQNLKSNTKYAVASGDSEYRIFGLESGLVCSEATNDPNSDDYGNGWEVVLKEEGVAKSEQYLFNTDASTTKTAYDAYTA